MILRRYGRWLFPAGFLLLFLITRLPTLASTVWRNTGAINLNYALINERDPTLLQKAEENWLQATQLNANSYAAWRGLGFVAVYQDEETKAVDYWNPAGAQAIADELQQWGDVAVWNGKHRTAQTWYKYSSLLTPDQAQSWFFLGQMHLQNDDLAAAQTAFETAQSLGSNNYELHIGLAYIYRQQKQWSQALTHYQQAITLKPDQHWDHFYTGLMYWYAENDLTQAQHHTLIAIELDPSNPTAHRQLGQIYEAQNLQQQAIDSYNATLALDPNDNIAQEQLIPLLSTQANQLRQQERWSESLALYQQVVTLEPNHYWYNAYTGLMYLYADNNLTEAENYFNIAISLDPNNTYAYRQLGVVYIRLERIEEALSLYNILYELEPTNESTTQQLIELLQLQSGQLRQEEQWGEALDLYLQLVNLNPNHYWYNAYTGLMYWYSDNNLPQTEHYFNTAITLNPDNPYAYRQLGQIYQRLEQTEQAIVAYETVLMLDPTDQFVQEQLQQLQNTP